MLFSNPRRSFFQGQSDGALLYPKHRSSNSRTTSSGISMSALPPILLAVALIFYVLGFIQSIRQLPDVNDPILLQQSTNGGAIGRALSPLVDYVRNKDALQMPKRGDGVVNIPIAPKISPHAASDEAEGNRPLSIHEARETRPGPKVPEAKWPVTIRDELDNFETIIHPGDRKTEMSVPKFWSDPLMTSTGPLMSRETAMQVGTFDTSNGKKKGSKESRTIFVAIASYRDFQCRETLDSLFKRARYPERVRVAIVDQIEQGVDIPCNKPFVPCEQDPEQMACKYKDNIDVYEMEDDLAVGPVFARHIGYRLYRGEYHAMQVDAHVTFVIDWDIEIIDQFDATKNEMAVLTTYLSDVSGSVDPVTGKRKRIARPIMCNTDYEKSHQGNYLRHLSQPERMPPITDMPQLHPYWAAGFSFSRGHFVVNIPYDFYQPMIFQGEEISIAIRAFTYGYDHYAPMRSICYHTYAKGENQETRNKVPHFWQNAANYAGVGVKAMKRLLGIVGMLPEVDPSLWDHREEERYGIGRIRSTEKFFETFGIDVKNKSVQHHLCSFVHVGTMHTEFQKHLRPDGMGIDYSKINYRFKDPAPDDKREVLE